YQNAVEKMAEKGIISGFPDGSFCPEQTLTRAQAAKILCVMLEGEEKANALTQTETGFTDVLATHWAAKFIAYCADKGIVAGIGGGKFDPEGTLSSAAFAKMLLVAYGEDGAKFTGADWVTKVQTAAEPTFLPFQIKFDLTDAPVQRQEAATLAFNAMFQAEAKADKEKGDSRTLPERLPETVKLLVIGNSFGNDCSIAYLYRLLEKAGVKNVVVGTLYYSGCPYEKHLTFGLLDQSVYTYYKNTKNGFASYDGFTLDRAIANEDWNYILMLSGYTGHPKDFGPCPWQDLLLYYVRRSRPDAYYGFDMTWAFQAGSDKEAYVKYYDSNQMKMYSTILETTKQYVVPEQRFKFIAPVGTAIQNARTSFIGDHLDRDGYHLNKGIGRYIATMTVCCTLTGCKPEQIDYLPEAILDEMPEGLSKDTPGILEKLGEVARESVANALARPYEVTQSKFTTAP
ncbi:MAG: DUF4886 domain-containing protein, partial [Oscillospiraceae bacterium]|nr:DUF4886 domain-containing protein [Oscillospiraceae bacterium]